jgi:hypothetical protein
MNSSQNLNHLLLREELHNKQSSVENGPSVSVNICGSKEIKEGKNNPIFRQKHKVHFVNQLEMTL